MGFSACNQRSEVPKRNCRIFQSIWREETGFSKEDSLQLRGSLLLVLGELISTYLEWFASCYISPNISDLLMIITFETKAHVSDSKCQELMLPLRPVYVCRARKRCPHGTIVCVGDWGIWPWWHPFSRIQLGTLAAQVPQRLTKSHFVRVMDLPYLTFTPLLPFSPGSHMCLSP
jgi:hypothetical protein